MIEHDKGKGLNIGVELISLGKKFSDICDTLQSVLRERLATHKDVIRDVEFAQFCSEFKFSDDGREYRIKIGENYRLEVSKADSPAALEFVTNSVGGKRYAHCSLILKDEAGRPGELGRADLDWSHGTNSNSCSKNVEFAKAMLPRLKEFMSILQEHVVQESQLSATWAPKKTPTFEQCLKGL